jgi:hypothetical protein
MRGIPPWTFAILNIIRGYACYRGVQELWLHQNHRKNQEVWLYSQLLTSRENNLELIIAIQYK